MRAERAKKVGPARRRVSWERRRGVMRPGGCCEGRRVADGDGAVGGDGCGVEAVIVVDA